MAWTVQPFRKLYFKVNGGPEQEWNGLLTPPNPDDILTTIKAHAGTNWNESHSASFTGDPFKFYQYATYNGGNGQDFWQFLHDMPNNTDILIYKEPGYSTIASLVIRKTAAGLSYGVSYNGAVTIQTGTNWGFMSIDSSGNTHPSVINVSTINYGVLKDDSNNYTLYSVAFYGQDQEWGYDTNGYRAETGALGSNVSKMLKYLIADNEPIPDDDPYAGTGESAEDQLQTGPAQGDGDDTSDVISIPSTPSLNLAACQMINVYVPSLSDVQSLASYLWTNFDLHDVNNTLSKVFTDPINAILSLHILPFTPNSSTAVTVTFGGYATSVQIPPASEQFHDVDCGSISFSEFWGNYLDYNPYTRITACLPFVGQVDLDPDEVMGKAVKIKYRVDIVTGAFVCFLYIDGEKVLGQYAGNMAQQVPVSAADFSRLNAAILNVASTAAAGFGGAVMGGFSAASAAEGGISAGLGLGQSAVDNVLNAKVRVAHSGGLSGSPGIMGVLKPYVIIHRARQSVPADANAFKGYPCNAKFNLADLEGCGFTVVRDVKLDGLKLSEGELEELRGILGAGVYL